VSSTNFSSKLLLQIFFLLISFSNFSLQHLQFSLISLLLFSFFNFCLAIYLAPPCFPIHASPMQEEMGIGKLSIFKPYLSLLLCGVQFLEGLVLCVCVCVFFGYCFCANWKFLIFFVLHLFFSFHQLKNQKICKPGFINSTNHNPSPILNLGPFWKNLTCLVEVS
jgi:hypothetical protein